MATIPVTPYSLKNATFSVAADDYTAAINQVRFTPSTSASTWRGIGGNVIKDQTIAEWSCVVTFLQDLEATSFARYLHANDGAVVAAEFIPKAGGPSITATVVLSPGDIGGAADGNLAAAEVTLAVQDKPEFVDPTP